jgi:signal recognition particle subunit SRP54
MTLEDLLEQLESVRKLGPLSKILKMIPGLSLELPEEVAQLGEEKFKAWKAIILSMTPEERANPKILGSSRIRRVARGSGTSEREVRELIRQFEAFRKMAKSLKRKALPFKKLEKLAGGRLPT